MSEVALDDALFGEVLSLRVQQIIRLEREADDAQWEAARLISEELAEGKSQRQLAREIGKSHVHVGFMGRCWRLRGNYSYHSSFSEFYNSPEIRAASEKPEPTSAPDPLPLGEPEAPEPQSAPGDDPPAGQRTGAGDSQDLDNGAPEEPAGDPELPAPSSLPSPPGSPGLSGAAEKLERLRQIADDLERANPEEPVAELLDTQRSLRALIAKTRLFRAAGLRVNAAALIDRIDTLYQEWRELL